MNVQTITDETIRVSKPAVLKNANKLAGVVLGLGLFFSPKLAKANELKNDTFQKEKTELVSEDASEVSGDKTLVGESLLGLGILAGMGLALHSKNKK